MGYTKREIISGAFEEIGLGSYTFDLDPEYFQSALRRLDSMMASWDESGIRLGYPLTTDPSNSDLDRDSNLPNQAIEAVVCNLAMKIAPSFGKSVSPETRLSAVVAYNVLLAVAATPRRKQMPYGVPSGAGNKFLDARFLDGPIEEIDIGNDDILEF